MVKVMCRMLQPLGFVLLFYSSIVQATPDIQHWTTSNGARVYFVPSMDIPMLDVRVVFDAGSARDDIAGTALMTNGMLSEGAFGDSAQVLAEKFEAVGAVFDNGALKDMAWLGMRSLRDEKYLRPALINLRNILARPDFPAVAYQRELERLKVSVKASGQSPGTVAALRFFSELYGDHPYAQPSEGTEESLKKLQLNHLKQFYEKYYVARNAVVAIVGQLTRTEAMAIAEDLLKDLPVGEKAVALPRVKPLEEARTVYVDFPSAQSTVLMGQLGVTRNDADYFALYLGNHAFGGSGFGSRLMHEVREKRGLAYSTYSYFAPMRAAGPFQIGLSTRNDQVQQALSILRNELDKFVASGVGQSELDDSLKNITGGFPLRIDSNKKIAEYLTVIGFYDLPLNYLNTFVDNFNQQTPETVANAIKRRIDPAKMLTIIVGGKGAMQSSTAPAKTDPAL